MGNFCTHLSQIVRPYDVFLVTSLHFWVIVSIILKWSKQEKIFNLTRVSEIKIFYMLFLANIYLLSPMHQALAKSFNMFLLSS